MPRKQKVLILNPSTAKKKKKKSLFFRGAIGSSRR
jgi:hypothetical protein